MKQSVIDQLEALYATLPTVNCKRKCQQFCGPILISKIEAQRLEEKRGFLETVSGFETARRAYLPLPEIVRNNFVGIRPIQGTLVCPFLAPPSLGTCLAYSIRPLVCRLWGMCNTELMRCPHGCVPTRWVSDAEQKALHEQIIAIQKEESKG